MKIVRNLTIPFEGYKAMTIWPFIFVRKDKELNKVDENHEEIHGRQQIEMLVIPFLMWYCFEYIVRLLCYGFKGKKAYKNISFEQEAYVNETDFNYIMKRKHYAWLKYLMRMTYN